MKENSIEEDIAIAKKMITTKFNNDYSIDNKDKEAIEHILTDYKRVLKENEELKNNTRKNKKELSSLEFDVDGDWAELKKILNKSRKTNEYIMYKGEKWIKGKYCIPIQKVKDIIKELNIDIERNKRREINNTKEGYLQMIMIAYDPEIIKMRLLKLLQEEHK